MIKLRQMNSEIDVTPILQNIQAPTLIIHRVGDVRTSIEHARNMAATIPNARMVELPGKDHFVWLEESGTVLSEIRNFVHAAQEPVEADRVLATVLFTDIVNSTQQAAALGDMEWRSVLDAHFSMARSQIRRFRGREVKTLGDGILATFDGPARAVRCAQAIANSVKPLGIAIRAGLHTGEIEIRDDHDVGGIAVNIASRVSNLAGSSEVLVSSIVKDLVAGSGLIFNDLGPHAIKGLEEEWAASTSSLTADFGCCPVMFRSTTTPKGVVVQISSASSAPLAPPRGGAMAQTWNRTGNGSGRS